MNIIINTGGLFLYIKKLKNVNILLIVFIQYIHLYNNDQIQTHIREK
jgi:hypothetical protein